MKKSIKGLVLGVILIGGLNMVGCQSTEDVLEDVNNVMENANDVIDKAQEATPIDGLEEKEYDKETQAKVNEALNQETRTVEDICDETYNITYNDIDSNISEGGKGEFAIEAVVSETSIISDLQNAGLSMEDQISVLTNMVNAVYDAGGYCIALDGTALEQSAVIDWLPTIVD